MSYYLRRLAKKEMQTLILQKCHFFPFCKESLIQINRTNKPNSLLRMTVSNRWTVCCRKFDNHIIISLCQRRRTYSQSILIHCHFTFIRSHSLLVDPAASPSPLSFTFRVLTAQLSFSPNSFLLFSFVYSYSTLIHIQSYFNRSSTLLFLSGQMSNVFDSDYL